jgi:integrase
MTKFTDKFVRDLDPPAEGNKVTYEKWASADAVKGFGARITAAGARSFVLRYVFDGREYRYTIGAFPSWGTEAARREAKRLRATIDLGQSHPMAERDRKRVEAKARLEAETFGKAVDDYITREQIGRRKNATAEQVRRGLQKDCSIWNDRPVAEITAADIRKLLETIRDGRKGVKPRPYLSNRVHAYLSGFFRWCSEPGIEKVARSPMLGLRRPWEGEEARQRFFSDDELRALWKAGDSMGGVAGAYLKMLLLTGKRRTALAGMRWEDIDDEAGFWTPPSDGQRRRRNKRLHPIPLPRLGLRVLAGVRPRDASTGLVFPGARAGTALHPGSTFQRRVRQTSGVEDFFCHAARHTVETRMAELRIPPHIRDLILDHAPARGSGVGYDHHLYRDEMREALEAWAGHIEQLVAADGVKVLR